MRPPALEPRVLAVLNMAPLTRHQIARMCGTDVANINKVIASLVMEGRVRHDGWDGRAQRFALA